MNRSGQSSPRAGWRRSSRSTVPATPAGGYVVGQTAAPRLKLMFRVSLFAALIVGLGFILYWNLRFPSRYLPLVAVAVTHYDAPADRSLAAPPNPFAQEDLTLLERLYGQASDPFTLNVQFHGSAGQQGGALAKVDGQFMQRLLDPIRSDDLEPGGPQSNTLAFFISAHGMTGQDGQPYLLLADSRPDDESTWLSVSELLKELRKTIDQRPGAKPGTRAVVFLDAARWPGQWSWGDVHNTFAYRCEAAVKQLSDANTAVILSAASGQRSWCDVRSGGSLFAMALTEALGGQADGRGKEGREDGTIRLAEMVHYLQARVSAAAKTVWDAPQLPVLVATATDAPQWALMRQPSGKLPPQQRQDDDAALASRWGRVDALWKVHAQLAGEPIPPEIYDPFVWAALEHRLQRLDQLAISGKAYENDFETLLADCDKLLDELRARPLPASRMPPELALVERFGTPVEEEPVDLQAISQLWQKQPDPAQWKLPLSEVTAVRLLWGDGGDHAGWLEEQRFSAEALQAASRLLEQHVLRDGGSSLLESHLVRMFAQDDLRHLAGAPAQAVRAALQRSRAALLPTDVRALYWLDDELDAAERARRLETDRVLSGGSDAEAVRRLGQLAAEHGRLVQLQQAGQRLSEAYRIYDRALHHLPRLAETLLADPWAFAAAEPTHAGDSQLLAEATERVLALEQELEVPTAGIRRADIDGAIADAAKAAEEVEAVLERLDRRLADRVSDVVDREADDQRKLRQALALLTGTGVTDAVGRRAELRQAMIELISRSPLPGQPASDQDIAAIDPVAIDRPLAQGVLGGGQHFLLRWLAAMHPVAGNAPPAISTRDDGGKPSAEYGSLLSALDRQAATLRQAIAGFQSQNPGAVLSEPEARLLDGGSALQARQTLAELDRQVRAQTVLVTREQSAVSAVPARLFALDHQLFLTAMSRRMLDDFWCEAKPGEPPFFADAASRTLGMLATGWSSLPARIGGSSVQQLLEDRRAAAMNPLTLRAADESLLYQTAARRQITVQLPVPAYLPREGVVAISADHDPVVKAVPIETAAAAGESTVLEAEVTVPAGLDDAVQSIAVRSFFRGLRRSGQLLLSRRQGARLATYTLPDYGPPQILVSGEDPEPVPVVVVLDCSGSMEADDIVMPDGTRQSRMKVAREALRELLNRMQATGQFRVGLILYGHRWGWKVQTIKPVSQNPLKYLAHDIRTGQARAVATTDAEGNPAYDVEEISVLEEGALDQVRLAKLHRALDGIQPWGTTPLYLSIYKAFGLFDKLQRRPPNGHVIVLTDGRNDTSPFALNDNHRDLAIQAAEKGRKANVDLRVLLINSPDDAAVIEQDLTFADVVQVNNREQMIAELLRSIPHVSFQVTRDGDPTVGQADLGNVVTVEPWPPSGVTALEGRPVVPAERYRVQVATGGRASQRSRVASDILLQGGEYLELSLQGNRALQHVPYRPDLRDPRSLKMRGPGAEAMSVMVLRPEPPVRQVLEIPIVVQNADPYKFSPRPAAFWADITAIGDARSQQYSVTDMEFEAGRPVPVIRCRLNNWPAWATAAEIRLWVAMNPVRHERLPLERVGQPISVPGIEGVQFTVESRTPDAGGYELHIVQQHEDDPSSRGVFRLKVTMDPLPDSASHAYYPDNGLVDHVFRYDRPVTGLRAEVTEHAWLAEASASSERVDVPVPKK